MFLSLKVLSRPQFLVLFLGQFMSKSGDRIYGMASLWMTYQLTHSTVAMSGVEIATLITVIAVGSFGGVITDGASPLVTMIALDILSGLTLVAIPVLYMVGHLTVWGLVGTSIILTGTAILFLPSLQGLIPQMATQDELGPATGILDLTDRLSKIIGPSIAGTIVVLVPLIHLFTIDAVTFVFSAVSLIFVRSRLHNSMRNRTSCRPPNPRRTNFVEAMNVSSWMVLMKTPWLRTVTWVRSLNNGLWAFYTIGSPLFVQSHFNSGIGTWGMVLSAYGAGQVLGNVMAVQFPSQKDSLGMFMAGWFIIGLSFIGYAMSPSITIAELCIFLAGIGGPIAHVATNTRIGQTIPHGHMVGVFRLQKMLINVLNGVGMIAAGLAYKYVAPTTGILCAGLGIVLIMATSFFIDYLDRTKKPGSYTSIGT